MLTESCVEFFQLVNKEIQACVIIAPRWRNQMTVNCPSRCRFCDWKRRSVSFRVVCVRRKISGVVYATLFTSFLSSCRKKYRTGGVTRIRHVLWTLDTLACVSCSESEETLREIQNKEFFSFANYVYATRALEDCVGKTD